MITIETILLKLRERFPSNDFKYEYDEEVGTHGFVAYNPCRFGVGLKENYTLSRVQRLFEEVGLFIYRLENPDYISEMRKSQENKMRILSEINGKMATTVTEDNISW